MTSGVYSRLSSRERFENNYVRVPESGCWIWLGSISNTGYGVFWNEKKMMAHKYSYIQKHGSFPEGLQIDHLCRVRCCVNPDHLEAVSAKVNNNRSIKYSKFHHRNKTHCPKGHPYSGDNLYIRANGGRCCILCRKKAMKDFYARKKNKTVVEIIEK